MEKRSKQNSFQMKHFYTLVICCFFVLLAKSVNAQQRIAVSGTVIDGSSKNKEGLPGATISSEGRVIGSTDNDGKFRVTVAPDAQLTISYISFKSQTISVNNRTSITITLLEDANQLKAVEITSNAGYVSKSRALSTGSSVKISGEAIQGQPASDVMSLLQGKVAGLNIQNNTGAPGFRGSVAIRGISNINVSGAGGSTFLTPTSPLFVIDGVPVDDNTNYSYGFSQAGPGVSPLSQIPAEDVEDIEVLKDAAATALYGSRGAYGVILITTKRGASKVPVVRYQGSAFISLVPQLRPTIGGKGERMLRIDQILANDTSRTADRALDLISGTPFLADSLNAYYNNSTNWQSFFYRPTFNQNHNVTVSGGSQAFNYKVILQGYDEKGIQANTGYSRYGVNMNMTYQPTTRFRLFAQLQNTIQNQRVGSGNGVLNSGIATSANSSSLLPSPSLYSASNGLLAQLQTDNSNKVLITSSILEGEYEILKNLRLSSTLNYTNSSSSTDDFSPAALQGNQSRLYTYNGKETKLYNRTLLRYNKTFKDGKGEDAHGFLLFAFSEINASYFKADAMLNERGVNDQLRGPLTNIIGLSNSKGGTIDYRDDRSVAFAGSFSYNYKQKYVLDFNYRLDANSQNGINAGYLANPSVSVKWNFNRENWFNNMQWLDFADIRLSYGSNIQPVGNIFDAYGRFSGGGRYNNSPSVVLELDRVPNLDLQPTKATTLNAGFDIAVLKNKVSLSMDTYYKQNDNIFRYKDISSANSFARIASNEISNVNYGWEFQGTVRPLSDNSPFKWTLNANFAINREVLAKLPDGLRDLIFIDTQNGQDIYYRLGTNSLSNYLYNTKGVYANNAQVPVDPLTGLPYRIGSPGLLNFFKAGDPIFTDLDGNYVLNNFDKVIAGNSQPQMVGGFNSLLQWKNWTFEVQTSFTLDRDILNNPLAAQLRNYNNPTVPGSLVPLSQINYWNGQGNRAQYGNPNDYIRSGIVDPFRLSQTLFQEDGSYFKLNVIKVYYQLNQTFTRRYGMERVAVNLTGANLGFITRYSGPNPENVSSLGRDDSGGYPAPRQFTLGLNIEF
jgi:TonB-dependent starch-binding outer membrane protein SusC